jgi:hypothetical protein
LQEQATHFENADGESTDLLGVVNADAGRRSHPLLAIK